MIDGYKILSNGIVKQKEIFNKKMIYDENYIQQYEEYGEMGIRMSYLRLGNIIGSIGVIPREILDVGYGSGDFLKVCNESGIKTYGSDISGYPVPDGTTFIKWEDVFEKHFQVITFFDCLEHFEDISFVKDLNCDFIVISLPWCICPENDEWFKNWKHRKPDEHLWHFNKQSLRKFMEENGYYLQSTSNAEDVIRKPINDNKRNILTQIFWKK